MSTQAFFAFMLNGLRAILVDRVMVFTDFFLATIIPFGIQALLWGAIYSNSDLKLENFTYHEMLFYYAFVLVIAKLNNMYDVIAHLSEQIKEGKLEVFIVKPMSYAMQRLAVFLGESTLYFIPIAIVLMFFSPNLSILNLFEFILLLLIAQILTYIFALLLATATFWITDYSFLLSFSIVASSLLGGLLLPHNFWPPYLIDIMTYNPFRYMIAAPAEFIISGNSTIFLQALFGGVFYIFLFLFLFIFFWKKGLKVYTGAGG